MRIIDSEQLKALSEVLLLLDGQEIDQLIAYLQHLLDDPTDHIHFTTEDLQTEIMVARFDNPRPQDFHPDVKKFL